MGRRVDELRSTERYGGLGLTCLDHCLVLEELAFGCMGVTTTIAGNMLGTMPLLLAGSESQKQQYFSRLLANPSFVGSRVGRQPQLDPGVLQDDLEHAEIGVDGVR